MLVLASTSSSLANKVPQRPRRAIFIFSTFSSYSSPGPRARPNSQCRSRSPHQHPILNSSSLTSPSSQTGILSTHISNRRAKAHSDRHDRRGCYVHYRRLDAHHLPMVCIPLSTFLRDRLTIQSSNSKVLGIRAAWPLHKRP